MTKKEAIEVLENGDWWNMCDATLPFESDAAKALHDAIDTALDALREQPAQVDNEAAKRMEEAQALSDWLDSENTGTRFALSGKGVFGFLIRVNVNPDVDFLYIQYRKDGAEPSRVIEFKYAGIYCRKERSIDDLQPCLGQMLSEEAAAKLVRPLSLINEEAILDAVRNRVDELISAEPARLRVKDLSDPDLKNRLSFCRDNVAKFSARVLCVNGGDYHALNKMFGCGYTPHPLKDEDALAFLADPEGFADARAKEYIEKNQERILLGILCRDALSKEYVAIMANPEHPAHLMRKISAAVSEVRGKRVDVTVRINGVEVQFKESADHLIGARPDDQYRLDCLTYADHKKFNRCLPDVAEYSPKDIVRITYKKQTLYLANGLQAPDAQV